MFDNSRIRTTRVNPYKRSGAGCMCARQSRAVYGRTHSHNLVVLKRCWFVSRAFHYILCDCVRSYKPRCYVRTQLPYLLYFIILLWLDVQHVFVTTISFTIIRRYSHNDACLMRIQEIKFGCCKRSYICHTDRLYILKLQNFLINNAFHFVYNVLCKKGKQPCKRHLLLFYVQRPSVKVVRIVLLLNN